MEKKKSLYAIKSKYTFKNIFDFVGCDNFVYKLFIHSKKFQKRLDITIADYKCRYFKINLFKYLSLKCTIKDFYTNILKDTLNKDLILYNIKNGLPPKYIFNFFKENSEIIKDKELSIYSPLFDFLSKNDIFKYFNISIPVEIIEKFKLKNDFSKSFNELNSLNSNYTSIILKCQKSNDLKYLNEFKINLEKIKKLSLWLDSKKFEIDDYYNLLNNLFSINILKYNLTELNINSEGKSFEIDEEIMDNINQFEVLEDLRLNGFEINGNFILKLGNLKSLYLSNCYNISFEEKFGLQLNTLDISFCRINKNQGNLIKFPKLKECFLIDDNKKSYNSIIDFKSLANLKSLNGTISKYFILLDNSSLESICFNTIDYNLEKQIFEKILSIKTLKEIYNFGLFQLNDKDISQNKIKNESVKSIFLHWNASEKCILKNFINKFPNLTNFSLKVLNDNQENNIFQIRENPSSKIDKIDINCSMGIPRNLELYCNQYKNLKEFHLNVSSKINLEQVHPFFNYDFNVIFYSLTIFEFVYDNYNEINLDILKNIYNNIDNMPILKNFKLECFSKNISKEFHFDFIKKLFSKNLNFIYFQIKSMHLKANKYTIVELRKLFPKFNTSRDINNINVYKLISN